MAFGPNSSPVLSVVIPTLNEANQLPLLFADLHQWPSQIEVLIVDAGSSDKTKKVAQLSGARFFRSPSPNRGAQLREGASLASGAWLLFLHADCRLPKKWYLRVKKIIKSPIADQKAWFFDFRIKGERIDYRLLEIAVHIRSAIAKRPYGDQGLLISKHLYNSLGGFSPIHIMEDIDFIQRIKCIAPLKRIAMPIYTDGRKWANVNIIIQAIRNARLRRRWRRGEPTSTLLKEYYKGKG